MLRRTQEQLVLGEAEMANAGAIPGRSLVPAAQAPAARSRLAASLKDDK
jgi:hypothetical protein